MVGRNDAFRDTLGGAGRVVKVAKLHITEGNTFRWRRGGFFSPAEALLEIKIRLHHSERFFCRLNITHFLESNKKKTL